jgi:transposase
MEIIYGVCCGVDVHKKMVVACLKTGKNKKELRQYGTTTKELREMSEWLQNANCEMVAMESTGSYWKPIYNVLEALGLDVIVVNAHHIKTVPGRKTDMKDAEWIADLLMHGLLKASYIPNKEQRELREISRYRKALIQERAREKNRLEKVLEGANIKLSSVLKDVTGVSAKNLIKGAMEGGVTEDNIDAMLYSRTRNKKEELLLAMDGVMTKVQKMLVKAILDHIDDMTKRIKELDEIIDKEMENYDTAIRALDEIPGIGIESAQTILAEIGLDMSRFPTAAHLASWCGLCPGNNESAGKRKSGKTCKGNKTLKSTLIQCAQTAVKKKGTFFKAQYERLTVRRGKNRAKGAVAHSIIIAIWNILNFNTPFKDLGADYYIKHNPEKKIGFYLKKLSELGWQSPVPNALAS